MLCENLKVHWPLGGSVFMADNASNSFVIPQCILFKQRIVFLLSEFLFCNVAIWTKKYAYFVVAVFFFKFRVYRALSLYIKRVSLLVRDLLSREIHSLYSLHNKLGSLHNALSNPTTSASEITQICTLSRGYYKTYHTLQERKKKNNKLHKHQRWNVRSDQRNLGFQVGYCHVPLPLPLE